MHRLNVCTVAAIATLALANHAMAGATQVNIVDPNKGRAANVEVGNRLAVQEVPPATFYHASHNGLGADGVCARIAGPPGGKALIVRQVRVNTYIFGNTPGGGYDNTIYLYANSTCDGSALVATATLSGTGLTVIPFDPGVTVPMGYGFSAEIITTGNIGADTYVDGYVVPANVAPVVGQIIEHTGGHHR